MYGGGGSGGRWGVKIGCGWIAETYETPSDLLLHYSL